MVRGDTLTRIAKSHGVSVEDLQAWNALSDDRIEVGQRLIIRGASATEPVRTVTAKRKPKPSAGSGSSLSMPKAKACLKGPSLDDLDDDTPDIQASAGLSMAQVREPMRAAVGRLGDCIEGTWPDAVVDLSITVGMQRSRLVRRCARRRRGCADHALLFQGSPALCGFPRA